MQTKSTHPLSAAALLAAGLHFSDLPTPPAAVPPGTRCALTGQALTHGYPAQSILPSSTGDPLDVLGGDVHGWLSPEAARVLAGDWNLGGRALFQEPDGHITAFYPRVAGGAEAAAEDLAPAEMTSKKLKTFARDGLLPRPLWRDLVRSVWPARAGQHCLLLLATDPKKRVWYKARTGALGSHTPLYLFDNARHQKRPLTLDWPVLLTTLDLVETIYAAGFSKRGIEAFLLSETKAAGKAGMQQVSDWEFALRPLRPTPEFLVSVIIAQKPELQKPTESKPTEPKGN